MKIFLLLTVLNFSANLYSNDTIHLKKNADVFVYYKKSLSGGNINLQINNHDFYKLNKGKRIKIELEKSDRVIELSSSNKMRLVKPIKFKPELGRTYYVEVSIPHDIEFTLKDSITGYNEFNDNSNFSDQHDIVIISEKKDNLVIADTITYRSKPILNFADFKAEQPYDSSSGFYLDISIVTFIKSVNVWTGRQTLECFAGIRRDLSWIDSDSKTNEQLIYAQLKYDIANYYSKLAERRMNSNKSQIGHEERIKSIIEEEQLQMKKTFEKMDFETDFGKKNEKTQTWIENYK